MRSGEFIQRKFQAWARRHDIKLQGSEGDRGEPNYVCQRADNFFHDLDADAVTAFAEGAGGELRGEIPSLFAMHSSAALAVNLFQYWSQRRNDFGVLARLLEIPSQRISSIRFERQYPVCVDPASRGFSEPPHLDVGIDYEDGQRVGVECKLFEPYGRLVHETLKEPYFALDESWADIPACRSLAEQLRQSSTEFRRLGPAQLLRHILGLKFQAKSARVRLVYLYFDSIGDEAVEHHVEVKRFQERIAGDPVRFCPMSVQDFLARAFVHCGPEHRAYVDWMTDRYM